jgi:hypothetical protein
VKIIKTAIFEKLTFETAERLGNKRKSRHFSACCLYW